MDQRYAVAEKRVKSNPPAWKKKPSNLQVELQLEGPSGRVGVHAL